MDQNAKGSFKNSENYMWCESDSNRLGTGALSFVYKGIDKRNGEAVAVKVLKESDLEILERQQKEYNIIKGLSHKNVVNMLAYENEVTSKENVLVMELCNGRDLQAVLEQPQNHFGLDENEFLSVLKDLTSAMKYLRDNNISHRDLKPLNILKVISDDNSSIYKVGDFDASRKLRDDQEFVSMHGTPQYMCPQMYKQGVLFHDVKEPFKATVDLWSIGVTLYQLATGLSPFRPYRGRSSNLIRHYIMAEKKSGVISGVQLNENGLIDWSEKLPDTCLLNENLRNLVTDLIAGLLENNCDLVWSFEQYFNCVADIFERKTFYIFHLDKTKEFCLYMKPNQTMKNLKDEIANHSKILISNLMLLWENPFDLSLFGDSDELSVLPNTAIEKPLIVLDLTNICWTNVFAYEEKREVKEYSKLLEFFHATETHNPSNYISALKNVCIQAHRVKRFIMKIVRCINTLLKIPKILKSSVLQKITILDLKVHLLSQKIVNKEYNCKIIAKSVSVVKSLVSLWSNNNDFEEILSELTALLENVNSLNKQVKTSYTKFQLDFIKLEEDILPTEMNNKWCPTLSCTSLKGCAEKANTYVTRLDDAYDVYNSKVKIVRHEFLELERIQNMKTVQSLSELERHCLNTFRLLLEELKNWYSGIQGTIFMSKHLEDEFVSVNGNVEKCISYLSKAQSDVFQLAEKLIHCKLNPQVNGSRFEDRESNSTTFVNGENSVELRSQPKKILSMIQKLQNEQSELMDLAEESLLLIGSLASVVTMPV